MTLARLAGEAPDRLAIAAPTGDLTFGQLNARTNQLARALRELGLQPGDGVALVCSNRPEFAEVVFAVLRSGLRLTPINWHLTHGEMVYIARNCEARAIVADARFAEAAALAVREIPEIKVRLSVGGAIAGYRSYDDVLDRQPEHDLEDPLLGSDMLYTSGTTGRPRGVLRGAGTLDREPGVVDAAQHFGFGGSATPGRDLCLCTGPLYHAAPLAFTLTIPIHRGCGVVMMDGWDAERFVELVEGYRITHTHMVPLMFRRLLAMDEEVRVRSDLSSLRFVLHGGAPCPPDLKRQMIDWLGPVVYEYYAATEGWGCLITAEEWLEKPGSVGRPSGDQIQIRDDAGALVPADTPGLVYLRSPEKARFQYFKDPQKTRGIFIDDHFTLGDIGYLDADHYLFLCDRSADVINSGGVNIYPAEVDAVLMKHAVVREAATVGVPHPEWGEAVLSVVELEEGALASPELAHSLSDYCRQHLAHFKCPRQIEFTDSLPRYETGKIYRRILRDRYWAGHEKKI